MSYFICGAQTAEYLQQLMYEADLEAYKKSKRKNKHKRKMENINILKDKDGIWDLSKINFKKIKFIVKYGK